MLYTVITNDAVHRSHIMLYTLHTNMLYTVLTYYAVHRKH